VPVYAPEVENVFDEGVKALAKACLNLDPEKRPTMDKVGRVLCRHKIDAFTQVPRRRRCGRSCRG
jgi:hypothetical protein